ncbi:MAG: ribosomal L7Ae/L30e/S12e/Gadd45 family protein [Oscillospiraceae bacterium]
MKNDKLLGAVSMCRRAGKLTVGFDATVKAVTKGAELVITASDAADRTLRNIEYSCADMVEIMSVPRTQDEIEQATGRKFAVAAVCDKNFARLIKLNIEEANI